MTTNQDATVPDAAIEAAQHAMMWVKLPFGGNDLFISLDANAACAAAKLAYDAMAPIIAAQAKAAALREAARELSPEGPDVNLYDEAIKGLTIASCAEWLEARTATIEGATP